MSIATLKRKTQTKYNNMSVDSKTGFSLNGTLRNQGYVGQTSLSRSLPKTMMKGNVKRGHGGCSGTYNNAPIVQSAVTSLNDPNVIKKSVVNTHGMIESKYMWTRRPFPNAVVKPDYNNHFTQGDYIKKITKIIDACNLTKKETQPISTCTNPDVKFTADKHCINISKPESNFVAMSQGEYLLKINKECTQNDKFEVNTQRTPFDGSN